jgi:hypothetical protein
MVCGPREKRERGPAGPKGKRGEGRGFFLKKFFSNSFFKLSNFTQTRNHAFKS